MDSQYKYTYERTSNDCYPKSDVLINLLNITDAEDLSNAERELVSLRAKEMTDLSINGNFDFSHLKRIHKYLFQDIFGWAGQSRTCNIAKTNLFCLAEHIDTYAKDVFGQLIKENYCIDLKFNDKVEALAELFADINALHPFREGNGRTQREFMKQLAKVNGMNLDFTKVNEQEMIIASSESIAGDMEKLRSMFQKIAAPITKEEQLKAVDDYIESEKLKSKIKKQYF